MQSSESVEFELRFDAAALPELANRYSFQDDSDALAILPLKDPGPAVPAICRHTAIGMITDSIL